MTIRAIRILAEQDEDSFWILNKNSRMLCRSDSRQLAKMARPHTNDFDVVIVRRVDLKDKLIAELNKILYNEAKARVDYTSFEDMKFVETIFNELWFTLRGERFLNGISN